MNSLIDSLTPIFGGEPLGRSQTQIEMRQFIQFQPKVMKKVFKTKI